jgi:hypothetical protein
VGGGGGDTSNKPNLDPTGLYFSRECTDDWFISATNGALLGNGKFGDDPRKMDQGGGLRIRHIPSR